MADTTTEESTTPDGTEEKPAAKKATAAKGTAKRQAAQKKVGNKLEKQRQERIEKRDYPPTVDEALAIIQKALNDPDVDGADEAVEFVDTLVRDRADEGGDVKPTNVYEAIWAVMRDVRHVGKHGRNEDQNYSFRGIDDVMNALGPAMRKHGLLMFPKVVRKDVEKFVRQTDQRGNQKFSTAVQVEVRYRFVFAPGGKDDYEDVFLPGESIDTSDKATAKAMSVALRTAMLQTFALPTYDTDPDQHNPEIETPQPITAEEVQSAAQWAAQQSDLDAAFLKVRESFGGRPMDGVTVTNKHDQVLNPDEYLTYVEQTVRAHRAQVEAEKQDQAAQGDTRDQGQANAQPAREQQPEARAPQEPQGDAVRAQEQGHQAASARAQQAERRVNMAKAELKFQADVLGQDVREYAEPATDNRGFNYSKAHRYAVKQRELISEALREQGRASEADAYGALSEDQFPIDLGSVFGRADDEDRAAQGAQEPARQQ